MHDVEDRYCHQCGYLLLGLPELTRCPECGTKELPNVTVRSGLETARWWRIALLGPIVSHTCITNLWQVVLHLELTRTIRSRNMITALFLISVVFIASGLSGYWVYKPASNAKLPYIQRSWWYETERSGMGSVSEIRLGSRQSIFYQYAIMGSGQGIWQLIAQIFQGRRAFWGGSGLFMAPWIFLIFGWPVLCHLVCSVEQRRAFRMAGLLAFAFLPFLFFAIFMILAKLAWVFFQIDWRVLQILAFIHVSLALWPGLTFARYATCIGPTRWRGFLVAALTFVVTIVWPLAKDARSIFTENFALNWL